MVMPMMSTGKKLIVWLSQADAICGARERVCVHTPFQAEILERRYTGEREKMEAECTLMIATAFIFILFFSRKRHT